MKCAFLFFVALTAFAQEAAPPPPSPSVSAESCYLDGLVTNRATGAPIERAAVIVMVKINRVDYEALTFSGADGRFQFAGLPAGKYQLFASQHNGLQNAYGAAGPGDAGKFVILAPGEAKRGLLLPLDRMPSISGRVLDEEGDPVPRAQVTIIRDGISGGRRQMRTAGSLQANSHGEYTAVALPGRYFVLASDRLLNRSVYGSDVTANRGGPQGPDFAYGFQFYPGTQRQSEAKAITVGEQDARGIDIRLPRVAKVNVTGRLTGGPETLPKQAPPMIHFQADDVMRGTGTGPNFGISFQPDNSFMVYNVLSGSYLVTLEIAGPDGTRYYAEQRVEISPAASEINLRLFPEVELKGVVQLEGEVKAGERPVSIGLGPKGDATFNMTPRGNVKEDLTFSIPNVPQGVWEIGVGPLPSGDYIKAMMLGDRDVLTQEMTIGTETPPPLKIVIGARSGTISGKVENAGAAQPGILAVPEGKFRHVLRFYKLTRVNEEDDRYTLMGITPGKYRLFAFDKVDRDVLQNPELWKPYEALGEVVDVPEGGNLTKNLRMIVTGKDKGQQ